MITHDFPSSKNIARIEYEPASLRLVVHFHGGRAYEYPGVSEATVQAFIQAPSAGQFFQREIRGRYTEARRIDQGENT